MYIRQAPSQLSIELTLRSAGHALTIFQNHSTTSSDGLLYPISKTFIEAPSHLLAPVVGVFLPVIHVDLGHTADEQLRIVSTAPHDVKQANLKLSLVEHIDELLRDELVEPGHERLELL